MAGTDAQCGSHDACCEPGLVPGEVTSLPAASYLGHFICRNVEKVLGERRALWLGTSVI